MFWQNEVEDALRAMERAYALLQSEHKPAQAAWSALWLASLYLRLKGNRAVAAGWVARCERLTAQAEPSAELGRVILMRALATEDPEELATAADQAMEIARRFGDADYEALALAYSGLARLSLGRLKEGLLGVGLGDCALAAATRREPNSRACSRSWRRLNRVRWPI